MSVQTIPETRNTFQIFIWFGTFGHYLRLAAGLEDGVVVRYFGFAVSKPGVDRLEVEVVVI